MVAASAMRAVRCAGLLGINSRNLTHENSQVVCRKCGLTASEADALSDARRQEVAKGHMRFVASSFAYYYSTDCVGSSYQPSPGMVVPPSPAHISTRIASHPPSPHAPTSPTSHARSPSAGAGAPIQYVQDQRVDSWLAALPPSK